MKTYLLKSIFSVFVFGLCGQVIAGTGGGRVLSIYAHDRDIVLFRTERHLDAPACGVTINEWAISIATPTGKAQYALLLAAAAQGRGIFVQGKNDCSFWGDREAPLFIVVNY